MINIVIPVDLCFRPKNIIEMLRFSIVSNRNNKLLFIIAHNDRGSRFDKRLNKMLSGLPNVRYVSGHYYDGLVNNSLLRNIGASEVQSSIFWILDADIYPDYELLESNQNKMLAKNEPYRILPCLYLSAKGTSFLKGNKVKPSEFYQLYLNYHRMLFVHLASPSSGMCIRKCDFEELSGFDEAYTGHGYEDFDFILRLIEINRSFLFPEYAHIDSTNRSPLFAVGFRAVIGLNCVQHLIDGNILLHCYHEKNKKYYVSDRLRNKERFQTKFNKKLLAEGENSENFYPVLKEFMRVCRNSSKDLAGYSVLFDNRSGNVERFDKFRERVKFALGISKLG